MQSNEISDKQLAEMIDEQKRWLSEREQEEILALHSAFARADDAWQAELVRQFGKRAGDERYSLSGKSGPVLGPLFAEFARAGQEWRTACQVARGERPVG